jgi:hypothetical protein
MKALFENFELNSKIDILDKLGNINIKDYYLYNKMNNNQNMKENISLLNSNLLCNEKINELYQSFKELNFQYFKERQNAILNNKQNEKISYSKNDLKDGQEGIKKEKNDKRNKFNADSLSEIKKFKTELCHSWELTGTCKYGLNVSFNIYN